MKLHRQSHIGISTFIVTALALACTGAMAGDGGNVSVGGRSATEVLGRASGSSPGAGVQSVRATSPHQASEVLGRGNQMAKAPGAPVASGTTEVADFGRGSMILARSKGKQGQEDVTVAASK